MPKGVRISAATLTAPNAPPRNSRARPATTGRGRGGRARDQEDAGGGKDQRGNLDRPQRLPEKQPRQDDDESRRAVEQYGRRPDGALLDRVEVQQVESPDPYETQRDQERQVPPRNLEPACP